MKPMTLKKLCKELSLHSMFVPGGTFSPEEVERLLSIDTIRYDLGKYMRESLKNDIRPTRVPVWYVSRTYRGRPYITIMTYNVAPQAQYIVQNEEDLAKLSRICAIWDKMTATAAA